MNKIEFKEGVELLQNNYNQVFSKEKLAMWWTEFKEMNSNEYIEAIKKLISKNKFMPNIAEIKFEIQTFNNCNVNSSYWYANERIWCDRNKVRYYDITKGPDFQLAPFKD